MRIFSIFHFENYPGHRAELQGYFQDEKITIETKTRKEAELIIQAIMKALNNKPEEKKTDDE